MHPHDEEIGVTCTQFLQRDVLIRVAGRTLSLATLWVKTVPGEITILEWDWFNLRDIETRDFLDRREAEALREEIAASLDRVFRGKPAAPPLGIG